jgi:hypothetical protein
MFTRRAAAFTALLLTTPATALACPVCGLAGTGDNNGAYLAMTVMLSAVPLGMIVGLSAWLVRRNIQRGSAETVPNPAQAPKA